MCDSPGWSPQRQLVIEGAGVELRINAVETARLLPGRII
jgi:hypothetical protein